MDVVPGTTDCSGELVVLWLYGGFVHPQPGMKPIADRPKVIYQPVQSGIGRFCQTFCPGNRGKSFFWRWPAGYIYKFASRSSRGYSFGVYASHSPELQPAGASVASNQHGRESSYSRRWMTLKRCFQRCCAFTEAARLDLGPDLLSLLGGPLVAA